MAAAPTKTAPKTTSAPPAKTRPAVAVAQAPAVQAPSKTGKIKVPQAVIATYDKDYIQLQKDIDALERSVGLMTTGLVQEGFVKNAIHTGVLNYDFVVGGGAAPACMTVIPGLSGSGKSTVVDNLAALCCFQDIPVFWYDAEAALDPSYVSRIFARYGLNLHDLMGRRDAKGNWEVYPRIRYSNDAGGERIFKMMAGICDLLPKIRRGMDGGWYRQVLVKGQPPKWEEDPRQGKPQYLFIVDSWPALLPEARENNMDASPMAAQARMISAYMNFIKSPIAMTNSVLYSVNQIRTRPGVTMGCLHADTVIPFVDGSSFTIQQIVDEQIQGQVWSLNETTGVIEPKSITGWHDNGLVDSASEWVHVTTCTDDGAISTFVVTPDHEVKDFHGGWKAAKDLVACDCLVTRRNEGPKSEVDKVDAVQVVRVERGTPLFFEKRRKFDITVEDNHNYIVGAWNNGVVVHNSPEYEPAGAALEFYADVRTQLRKVAPSTIKAGTGQYTEEPSWHGNGVDKYVYAKIKNTKNKKFTPFRESTIRIAFERDGGPGDGICRTWDVMQFLLATGQAVSKNGRLELNILPSVAKGKAPPIPHGTLFTRAKFKHLVEAPQNKDGLYQHCLRQIRSGYAFEVERSAVRALITHDNRAENADAVDGFGDTEGLDA